MEKNYFIELNSINVNDKVEKKNGLNYLSWAYAWGEVKKLYPNANYKVYETIDGCIYFTDGRTAWVKTGVIINDIEHIEYLPIMDYKNKSIPLEQITSFDVNKTIQRSLTKAVARHGLGLYIYAGEDLPEDANEEVKAEVVETKKSPSKDKKQEKITKQAETFMKHIEEPPLTDEMAENYIFRLVELQNRIDNLCEDLGKNKTSCYDYYKKIFGVKSVEDMNEEQLQSIIDKLESVRVQRQ